MLYKTLTPRLAVLLLAFATVHCGGGPTNPTSSEGVDDTGAFTPAADPVPESDDHDASVVDAAVPDTSVGASDTTVSSPDTTSAPVDTAVADTITVDSKAVDSSAADTTVGKDSTLPDTTVADSKVVDSTAVDTSAVDTSAVDTSAVDTAVADTSPVSSAWRKANLTTFTSYPAPGSAECIAYSGCTWAGQFAAIDGKMTEEWVKAHNIIAVHSKDFSTYKLKTLRLRQGTHTIDAVVYDECADSDCSGCCTANSKSTGFLIDIEKYSAERFGTGTSRLLLNLA